MYKYKKNIIQTNLKYLLESEILLLNHKKNSRRGQIITPEFMITSLKQLQRLVISFNSVSKNGVIVFFLENKMQQLFVERYIKSFSQPFLIKTVLCLEDIKKIKKKKFLIILNSALQNNMESLITNLLLDDLRFISFFNPKIISNTYGIYNFVGNIDNLRKITFLVVFILQTLNTLKNAHYK
jgi:hypothetical protein